MSKSKNIKKTKRSFKSFITKISIVLAIGAFLIICINLYVVGISSKHIFNIDDLPYIEKNSTAIALGARVYNNGHLSYVLKDRVDYAIELYQAGKVEKLLFSGDHGEEHYDEVNTMMDYAVTQGVDKQDIFLDHAGFSTYESIYRAKEIFECDNVIVITQKFHIYRAVYCAKRLGLETIGVYSNQNRYYMSTNITNNIREILARVKDFFFIEIVKPSPTYLGDKIPISGPAELTHDKN